MKLPDLFQFLQGKGIKVQQNEAGEFVVEEPTTPAQGAAPDAPSLSADEIAALKSIAALAPKLNALDLESLQGLNVVANFAKNLEAKEKADREQLVAAIKANATNVYSDDDLNGMSMPVLTKLNAQMNMSYAGLGGAQVFTNADDVPLSIKPVLLAEEKE